MVEWKPIESAPKDGRQIRVKRDDLHETVMWSDPLNDGRSDLIRTTAGNLTLLGAGVLETDQHSLAYPYPLDRAP
jgi:hypothetical protein